MISVGLNFVIWKVVSKGAAFSGEAKSIANHAFILISHEVNFLVYT